MNQKSQKIIFWGTPEFAAETLKALIKNGYQISAAVTQADKPAGRRQKLEESPVKLVAKKFKIEVFQPVKVSEIEESVKSLKPELGVLFAYGLIIPKKILDLFPLGILNIHPSLLPLYRGPSPVQTVILNNESQTGVTIIKLDEKMDHGPILAQKIVKIDNRESAISLHKRLGKIGTELLLQTLPAYLEGKTKLLTQDESRTTFTKVLSRQDGLLDWRKTGVEIYNQFRAFYPWPGIFTQWQGKRLKIKDLSVIEGFKGSNLSFGKVFLTPEKELAVYCGQSAILLKILQLEGKKAVLGADFAKGYPNIIGQQLG